MVLGVNVTIFWSNTTGQQCKGIQESLASIKVSMRQPWYVGCNSLNCPSLWTPSNINIIYTSLKSTFSAQQFCRWQCGSIFIHLAAVASQTCKLAQIPRKFELTAVQGPILHHFWDTATYWLKIAYFSYPSLIWCPRSPYSAWNFTAKLTVRKLDIFPIPPLFVPPLPMFPLEFRGEGNWEETRVMGLLCGEVAWSQLQPFLTDTPMWWMVGQTDGQ